MTIEWEDEQLESAGLDKKAVASLVRRLERCAKDMKAMGLHLYGAAGTGHLIHHSRPTHLEGSGQWGPQTPDYGSIVATVGQGFDGGDW